MVMHPHLQDLFQKSAYFKIVSHIFKVKMLLLHIFVQQSTKNIVYPSSNLNYSE